MKKISLLFSFVLLFLGTWAQEMATVRQSVEGFNSIAASYSYKITLKKGAHEAITFKMSPALLPHLDVKVSGNMLYLNLKNVDSREFQKSNINTTVYAEITVPELQSVKFTGECSIASDDIFESEHPFNAMFSGSSMMQLNLRTPSVHVSSQGSCDIILNVQTNDLIIKSSGSNKLDFSGTVVNMKTTSTGSNNLHAFDLSASDVSISASGCSTVQVHAEKTLNVSATGSSSITYSGNPAISSKTSGSTIIKKKSN